MQFNRFVRHSTALVALASLAAMLTASSTARGDEHEPDSDDPRVRRGFEIAPVPLNLAGKDPAFVGLGSYLFDGLFQDCCQCLGANLTGGVAGQL